MSFAAVNYETFTLLFTKYSSNTDTTWLSAHASLLIPAYSTLSNRYNSSISLNDDTNYLQRFGMSDLDVPAVSLSVEGTLYNEVMVTISGSHTADPVYKKIVDYWAKNAGLKKRTDIYGGQIKTWRLLRYN